VRDPKCECRKTLGKGSITCRATHGDGWICTRLKGHSGNHVACGAHCGACIWEQEKTGAQLRDEGMAKVSDPQEKSAWKLLFQLSAASLLAKNSRLTSEEVTSEIGNPPGHPNLIGACMRKFAVDNKLVPVGMTKSKNKSRHAGRAIVWGYKEVKE